MFTSECPLKFKISKGLAPFFQIRLLKTHRTSRIGRAPGRLADGVSGTGRSPGLVWHADALDAPAVQDTVVRARSAPHRGPKLGGHWIPDTKIKISTMTHYASGVASCIGTIQGRQIKDHPMGPT